MGISARILLPDNVTVRHVADVIGILTGKIPEKDGPSNPSKTGGDCWWVKVPGVVVSSYGSSLPECANIIIKPPFPEHIVKYRRGQENIYAMYHFEPETSGRLLLPPSTNFWVAVGKGLAKFFGGKVDYDDCDDVQVNFYRRSKSFQQNRPTDGKPWYVFQERLLRLKSLTEKEIQHAYD